MAEESVFVKENDVVYEIKQCETEEETSRLYAEMAKKEAANRATHAAWCREQFSQRFDSMKTDILREHKCDIQTLGIVEWGLKSIDDSTHPDIVIMVHNLLRSHITLLNR